MTSLEGRRIAIIGGAGFIGHNLALGLKARGAELLVIDSLQVNNLLYFTSAGVDVQHRQLYLRMINERLDLLRAAGIPLLIQDARDYHGITRALDTIKPQVIIHLAAVSHAGRSNKDPFSTFDHSLRTLENALDYARYSGVEQFVYFSSSMVYGNFLTEKVDEDHPLNPIGIYGALKVAGEKMVIAYEQVFRLPFTIIRPSALYGPRCVSRRVGQIFIEAAMSGDGLRIAGDGTDRLDFTYIGDLTQGVMRSIGNTAACNEIFNITYGQSRSIADLVRVVTQHFPEVAVERVERDNLMPERGTLDVGKAGRLLGYRPQYELETGMARYIDWYRSMGAAVSAPIA